MSSSPPIPSLAALLLQPPVILTASCLEQNSIEALPDTAKRARSHSLRFAPFKSSSTTHNNRHPSPAHVNEENQPPPEPEKTNQYAHFCDLPWEIQLVVLKHLAPFERLRLSQVRYYIILRIII